MLTVSFINLLMYLYFIFVLKTVSPFRSIKTLSEKQTLSLTNLSRYSISVTVVVTGMYIRFVQPKKANTIKNKIILFIQLYLISGHGRIRTCMIRVFDTMYHLLGYQLFRLHTHLISKTYQRLPQTGTPHPFRHMTIFIYSQLT